MKKIICHFAISKEWSVLPLSVKMLLLTLLFIGCATVPTKQFIRTGTSYDVKMSQVNRVAIIADVCLMRDAVGQDDYWSIPDSILAGRYMVESAKNYLNNKGYETIYFKNPFIGSFKNRQMLKFVSEEGGQVGEMYPPLFVEEELKSDQVYKEALIKELSQVLIAVQQKEKLPSELCCSTTDTKEALDTIVKKTDAEAILFLIGNGFIVPSGKSIAQGLATGIITGVLTMGLVSVSTYDVSWMDTYAALVDSQTGEILWSNSLRLKGNGFTEKDYYLERWPYNILYHVPTNARGNTKK